MAQDIAYNLWMRSRVDLSSCVAVAKYVGAQLGSDDACEVRILPDLMAQDTGGEAAVGQSHRHKDLVCDDAARSTTHQVPLQSSGDGRQERQLNRNARFKPTSAENACVPIDVVQPKRDHLTCAKAVDGHQQKHRKVSVPHRSIPRDCANNPTDNIPRQCPGRPLIGTKTRSNNAVSKTAPEPTGRV